MSDETTFFGFSVRAANGEDLQLSTYAGKVILVVNVASKCGFTNQYEGLEAIHKQYADRGLVILGFPCDQFGGQEPGTDSQIQEFCRLNYGVTFPVLAKIEVNGGNADPVYTWLKTAAPGLLGTEGIKWNFTKFLIGRNGQVVERFAPQDKPEKLVPSIENALAAKGLKK